jgi:MerR HTH family regulatory protein
VEIQQRRQLAPHAIPDAWSGSRERSSVRNGRLIEARATACNPCDPRPFNRHTFVVPMGPRGAYPADRAAALSGVPKSTLHYWARQEILVPSLSAEKVKLWSYADLMALRTIYWLRQRKHSPGGARGSTLKHAGGSPGAGRAAGA